MDVDENRSGEILTRVLGDSFTMLNVTPFLQLSSWFWLEFILGLVTVQVEI